MQSCIYACKCQFSDIWASSCNPACTHVNACFPIYGLAHVILHVYACKCQFSDIWASSCNPAYTLVNANIQMYCLHSRCQYVDEDIELISGSIVR